MIQIKVNEAVVEMEEMDLYELEQLRAEILDALNKQRTNDLRELLSVVNQMILDREEAN